MKFMSIDEEYEKNKDLRKEDVQSLMEWVEKQPHLPKISELEVILFLHSCYYSQEASKHTIDTYYTCRNNCDDIFRNWNPLNDQVRKSMEVLLYEPLPYATEKGNKIIFIRFQDSDSGKFSVGEQIRVFLMRMKLWLLQEGTAPGHLILMDMSGITTGHLLRLNPFIIKKFFYFLQEAIPFRLQGLYFFDCVPFIDKVTAIISPFLKEGMLQTYTKGREEELYKYIPKHCFPKDYGGKAPSVSELHESMKKKLTAEVEFLKEVERTQKVNEKLRPGKANEIWGLDGSFKKLDID